VPQSRKPIDKAVTACRDRLAAAGFKKRSGEIFTIDVADDVLGWLGLNRAVGRSDAALEVNPVVGVRHEAIERMLAALKGEKFHAYLPPTVSVSLGYLMPEKRYQPWLFVDSNVTEMADAMVRAVEAYGLPFMKENASPQAVVALMTAGEVGMREQLSYRIPIAYHLLGDDDQACDALATALRDLGDRHDVAADRFRNFAAAFDAQCSTGSNPRR
jgi:hypothetical protein